MSDGHVLLVAASGELDRETVPAFDRCLDGAVEAGCSQVRIDLSEISFFDIAGYRTLVRFGERCHRRGVVGVWVNPSSSVRLVFQILGEPARSLTR